MGYFRIPNFSYKCKINYIIRLKIIMILWIEDGEDVGNIIIRQTFKNVVVGFLYFLSKDHTQYD
jgi:hypothetical protein